MAGGLLQLVATGNKDAPLTYNPEITFFKIVYKKYTNFAIQQTVKNLGFKNFGTYNNYKIDRTGDLLLSMYFKINIPSFNIIKNNISQISNSYLNINTLEIIYNNTTSYLFYLNNNFYIFPEYIFKLYNYNNYNINIPNTTIINNLLPEIINSYNIINNCILIDIKKNDINSIISLLSKYVNFFEYYILNLVINSNDYEYNNQLITQKTYINNIFNNINNNFYLYYNYYNNVKLNKIYYKFNEIYQYLNYKNINDINFITQDNYDVDVVYNYCLQNNILSYLTYQTNAVLFNAIFIYNILLQIYPSIFNIFTFWKKYNLLLNNTPDTNFQVNSHNTFGEWTSNLNSSLNPQLLSITSQLMDIYKQNYTIVENNIKQLFNLMNINNPSQLFILLSTFINQYNNTLSKINFDDYNSTTNKNLLNQKINEQLNNYNTLVKSNALIYAIPNIANYLTIYPIDLMVLYPYLAYKLVDILSSSLIFNNNMFLVYWRNKINGYFFLNYQQNNSNNINNSDLYDLNQQNRYLTFYSNFNLKNLILLIDIKKYFLELFYSTSFFGSLNMNSVDLSGLLLTMNQINITQLQVNNEPISLQESNIKSYNNLQINNTYNISNFIVNSYTIIINNWDNNSKINSSYSIKYNSIIYQVKSFINNNFILTLNFNYLPSKINSFILNETHKIKIPLVNFNNSNNPVNTFININIFNKTNSIIINNKLLNNNNIFNLNNLLFKANTIINNYVYYFKIINITINNKIYRYNINIINNQGNYQIITNKDIILNKDNISNIDLEFIYIKYLDITTKDATSIKDNKFIINNRNDWTYDPFKTYWLVYNNIYIIITYNDGYFYINDNLLPVIYNVREIDNTYIPSFLNYINYYTNNNNISDLMDFVFQTPMIFLAQTNNNQYSAPYLYFYNIPFLINNGYTQDKRLINSKLFLNNFLINIILPLNSNQFFGKNITTLYDPENLLIPYNHYNLINYVNDQFDIIYNDPLYSSIINTLEQTKQLILNLNLNFLNDTSYYGNTSNTIISNISKINNYDLINYNTEDFDHYNKLFIDLYNNNTPLISNYIIQNLVVNIYNYPATSYLPNRKISSDLNYYLQNIPLNFQDQINYISQNSDYAKVTNINEYLESYTCLNNIITNLENNIYDYGINFQINLLYTLDDNNFNSIYYNNSKIDISNIINNKILISNTFKKIINYDDQFTTEILESINENFNNNKFNYLGPIYFNNNNINFFNIIDISNYNFIKLDDNKIYNLNEIHNYIIENTTYFNSYLYNIVDTSNITTFYNLSSMIYYYKLYFDLSNNKLDGNCLYSNNNYFYINIFDFSNNIIELISYSKLDINQLNYFIGNINFSNINTFYNTTFTKMINSKIINFINIDIIEYYEFNYYNNLQENSNLYINYILNPIIKNIKQTNYIYIDSSNSIINLTNKNIIKYYILPPINFINGSIISKNNNEDIFINNSNNSYIKLNDYIFNINNINDISNITIDYGNYELSLLPTNNLILINYDLSGYIIKNNNQIIIYFLNLLNLPDNSYYLINNVFIYIKSFNYKIIINDININYYNIGLFNSISLLDNNYFNSNFPLFVTYQNIYVQENLLGEIYYDLSRNVLINNIPFTNFSDNNYVINSLQNNFYNNITNYDISQISCNSSIEQIIELNFYDINLNINLLRPIIISNNINNTVYPNVNFTWSNNNQIFNNSFIMLNSIPFPMVGFCNLSIHFTLPITSIITLQPSINIYSNTNFTSNIISFSDTTSLTFNKNFKWSLLINNNYPVYFWTYFTLSGIIYTNNSVSEPIYINQNNLNLFSITNNVIFNGSLPNIIINSNNILKINNNLYYYPINRLLINKYYSNSLFTNNSKYFVKEINYHPTNKYIPPLYLLDKINIVNFTDSFIYLDNNSINILLNATYLIIQNNNYNYTQIIKSNSEGIYIDTTHFILDNNYSLCIYYSYSNIIFNNNYLSIICDNFNNYKIINYQYNNLNMNELIIINNSLFQIIGLNYFNKYYDMILLNNNFSNINFKVNGYYSLGIPNIKPTIEFPDIIYNEPLIYNLDSINLTFGDYYINNNILNIKNTSILEYDIFSYNKSGININIYINNNNVYLINEFDKIKQNDILIYDKTIYIIKSIKNKKIFFDRHIILPNGFYYFYYPFQPFNFIYIIIDIFGNVSSPTLTLNDYFFIELDSIFYSQNNIPIKYYNSQLFTRIANLQKTKLFFENPLYLNKYINSFVFDNNTVIYLECNILDNYTIDLNINKINSITFFYYQPIRIGSTINFISSILYRDTTIIISVLYPINLFTTNIKIYLSPLSLHLSKYYSIYEIDNFRSININIANNILEYDIDTNIVNIFNNLNTITPNNYNQIFFLDNYNQIDINYINIKSNLYIGSYHIILEISDEKEFFTHLVKIIYPNNLLFYTEITNIKSNFYFDKIYKIKINFNDYSFIFDNNNYYKKMKIESKIINVDIWYKYPITIIGIPFYQDNYFYLQILNGNIFLNQNIYIQENTTIYYSIIFKNDLFYLQSDTYLGNNINFLYLKNINYLKSSNPITKTFKSDLTNHNDSRLINYFNSTIVINEKIVNKVLIQLNTIGDTYKYSLVNLHNNQFNITQNNTYFIGDPFLPIIQSFLYNSQTFIFTNSEIPNINNNETQLFTIFPTITEYFNNIKLFRTVPDIITKINLSNQLKPYYLLNNLKTWDSWSLLSSININNIISLLKQGNIKCINNIIIQDSSSNIFFTNDEFNYLSNLLLFINNNTNEINKINIQLSFLNNILNQLKYWINDSTFWSNVTDRINNYLSELNINATFNGSCLIFSDEINNIDIYFDTTDPNNIKRKYYLNNQFLLINNTITRNMNDIQNEINLLVLNQINYSSYGIELNELLNTLYNYGQQYTNIFNNIYNELDEDKYYIYFNSVKLFINNIWNNYKNQLSQLNSNFNNILKINYQINKSYNNIINYFDSNFNFISTNFIDISNNEFFIKDYFIYNNFNILEKNNYTLISDPIYPYNIIFEDNLIISELIYQINFHDIYYDSLLFNLIEYQNQIFFYLEYDFDTNIDYTTIGINNYNINSLYLGKLYLLQINNIDFNLIDYINYKNTLVNIYKYDNINLYISSTIDIEPNNILEIYKNIGIKNQINNYLLFYQNNFNYINNSTYIKYENILYQLNIDTSGNYYTITPLILPQIITIIILYNINSIININTYIYQLNLLKPFIDYNNYINNSSNIIPINFKLNNQYIPEELIFNNETELIVQTNSLITINNLSHYINIGETPPLEVSNISMQPLFLYNTYETYNLLPNSVIWISDSSNYLLGEIASTTNLSNLNPINFILTNNYTKIELLNKTMYIVNSWNINDYIFNPLNYNIIIDYPTLFLFNNSNSYNYYINNNLIQNNNIYINNNQIIIEYYNNLSGSFIFLQTYVSPSQIYSLNFNQVSKITLINNIQIINDVYFLPYNQIGNNIGLYLYKIILSNSINQNNISDIYLIADTKYSVKIFLYNTDTEIIIATNNILTNQLYKLQIANLIINIISLTFYQNAYQKGIFYYQDNINSFYVFMDKNSNNFNFQNQINYTRYYMSSITSINNINNILNPRKIVRSKNMLIETINDISNNIIIENPIINILQIFQSLSLFLGDQLIETINADTYNILYNFYSTSEKQKQILKMIQIHQNSDGWEIYFPLLFWFYGHSTLSLPLIALPYIDFNLKYKLNNINNILQNNLSNSTFSSHPIIFIELGLDTILLDSPERLLFGSYRHEYLIERFIIYPNNLIFNQKQTINIRFNNLVKDIFWISKPIYHPNETGYRNITYNYDNKYQYYLNILTQYNQYNINSNINENNINYLNDFQIIRNNNQEILLNNSNRIKIIKNDILLNSYDINYILFLLDKYFFVFNNLNIQFQQLRIYFVYIYKNNKIINYYDPITHLNLQSNGIDFLPNLDTNYYNSVIPYQKFNSSPDVGYYTTSFSLFPCDSQPSGHLNFNKFDNIVLNITSNPNINNEPYNLVTVVKEYQIFRIMSGLGSLAWIN